MFLVHFKPRDVSQPQRLIPIVDDVLPLLQDALSGFLRDVWVTRALEEFDFFFSLHFFQLSVVLNETLLILGQLDSLELWNFIFRFHESFLCANCTIFQILD